MAKKKDNAENDLFRNLAKDVGGEVLSDVDSTPGFIDSGILSLNFIVSGKFIGGGYPAGSMCECFGDSSTGKSLLGTNFLKGCQVGKGIAVLNDTERALSKEFAIRASHVDPDKLLLIYGDTLESSFNKIHKVIRQARQEVKIPKDRFIGFVWDSLSCSPCKRQEVENRVDMDEITEAGLRSLGGGPERPGERARICSAELRKLMPVVKENNACVFFVNQIRKNIGNLFGSDITTAGGGEALRFYCSNRLHITSARQLRDEAKQTVGLLISVQNIKSRFTAPFKIAKNIRLFFNNGIDPFSGLLELLRQDGRIFLKGAGNYEINEKYSDGKTAKFKSALERNTVPVDVLLDYPKLIDAESPEQILYYQDMFKEAISISNSENLSIEENSIED